MAATSPTVEEAHAAIECLRRLSDVFAQRRRQLAQDVGLTEHQWGVLEEISTEHFMPSMFARRRESSAAAVSKTIRQLLDKELIAVFVSPNDGRQRHYVLTDRGRQILDSLRKRRQEAIRAVWLKLDRDELAAFTSLGNELTERLEEYQRRVAERSPASK